MQKYMLILLFLVVLLIGVPFIPTHYRHILVEGTDRFEAHYPLWGNRNKIVSISAHSPITGVGLVLVNLRRAPAVASVHVRALHSDGSVLSEMDTSIAGNADDAFTWAMFPQVIAQPGETVIIEITAPAAQRSSAIGARFDTDSGELALALEEKIPAWEYATRFQLEHPDLAQKIIFTVIGGIILMLILLGSSRIPFFIALFIFACVAISIRIPLAHSIDSAYGGDAFNYLLKSRAWIDGADPFSADPRKAPLYSFLAIPGLANIFDAVTWERWVNITTAGGTVVLVSLFLRRLGVPVGLAIGGGALLAVNRDFQFESVQGLSNTVYAFFVLLSGYALLISRPYMLALASGLAFLTRYEGGAVAVVLMPFIFLQKNISAIKKYTSLGMLILLVVFPFMLFPFSHSIGIRTLSDIQSDDGLYLTHSMDDFWSNFKGFTTLWGRMWILTPNIGHPFFALGAGVALGIMAHVIFMRIWGRKILPAIPYVLALLFLTLVIRNISEEAPYIVYLFSLLAGIGIGYSAWRIPRKFIPILAMLIVQIIVITLILPKSRYYLPVIPYAAIAISAGIYCVSGAGKKGIGRMGSLILMSFFVMFTYVDAMQALPGQVSDYNEKSSGQTVLLNAARAVKYLDGIVGIAEGSDLQMRAYLPMNRVTVFPDSLRNIDTQSALLREKNVEYIVDTTENPYFAVLVEAHGEMFEKVSSFTTKWADTTATLYRLQHN